MVRTSSRKCAALFCIAWALFESGCARNGDGTGRAPADYAAWPTGKLLECWNPQPSGTPEAGESAAVGSQLQYRMAANQLTEAESQKYLDLTYSLDLFGARGQLARTASAWPLDGHAYVRVCTLYPVTTTHFRWRRAGEENWRTVSHRGNFAYLDLGAPRAGGQTARVEYELFFQSKRLWQGNLDVSYDGRGRQNDYATLVEDPNAGAWLAPLLQPKLRLALARRTGSYSLYPPPTHANPQRLHFAFKIEVVRNGVVVGESYTVLGRGLEPTWCGSIRPPESIEWFRPDLAFQPDQATWIIRLTSIPELAATSEFDDFPAHDSAPRPIWMGSIELPLVVESTDR
jgi:hypothetical protein